MGTFAVIPLCLLLASNALAITIPSTPTWPSGRCTDKSLTIPSWVIKNYKVAAGTATFRADNRASESGGGFIECYPGKKECQSSATADQMTVTWTDGANGNKVISFSQFWVCGDEGEKVIFTATGNTTITSCASSDCTSPITYLAPGSLALPVPLTPSQPSPPAGYLAPTCANVGKNQWTVSSVEYKNYTRGQCKQWYIEDQVCIDPPTYSYKGQYLNLVVYNNAISHNVSCSFVAGSGNYNLPSPLRCTGGNFNEITLDVTFSGIAPNFNLKVEEVWYCLENPATNVNSSVILASGNVPIPMVCESHTGVTGTSDDIVTICTDRVSSHVVDGVQVEKRILDPYSLVTAYPVHGGCTFDSIVNPTFYYRGMFFQTKPFSANDKDNVTLSRITVGLSGPGFADFFFYESKPISGSGINTVYSCSVYGDGKPIEQHWNCTYSFNPFTKVITQDKVWQCSDKDPKQPIYFDGSGAFDWSKNPYVDCTNPDNTLYCYWYGDTVSSQPGIPYTIPKVTASLVNVLPPKNLAQVLGKTVRVNGKWQKASDVGI
ncbi:hypothetical protein BCR34DRAFT_601712 [Clohesyomyces aquaticus]|uniref:Ig-like domain-containing protein n=1 Tax=Clohesyomyces aquaticus TaxID=1231657 RepID=A0A1Y1ZMA2_9PLEO|nr:hypothetical protein BCR34DRAFT_601712 [Clohesyomyces aquaticus]